MNVQPSKTVVLAFRRMEVAYYRSAAVGLLTVRILLVQLLAPVVSRVLLLQLGRSLFSCPHMFCIFSCRHVTAPRLRIGGVLVGYPVANDPRMSDV